MSLAELVQSSGWKNFMAKLYGIGASVVIIGALFKIQHWQCAGLMLTIGLFTEAIIFFFSAFEPLHEEVDWTLVYPELAGIPEDEPESAGTATGHDRGIGSGGGGGYRRRRSEADPVQWRSANSMKCSKKPKSLPIFSRNWASE